MPVRQYPGRPLDESIISELFDPLFSCRVLFSTVDLPDQIMLVDQKSTSYVSLLEYGSALRKSDDTWTMFNKVFNWQQQQKTTLTHWRRNLPNQTPVGSIVEVMGRV